MTRERAEEYAGGDIDFADWLVEVNEYVEKGLGDTGIGLFDLADVDLGSSYLAGDSPLECAREVVADGLSGEYSPYVAEFFLENLEGE